MNILALVCAMVALGVALAPQTPVDAKIFAVLAVLGLGLLLGKPGRRP